MEGRRVQIDQQFCTVRYMGSLQGQDGVWIGVEWDDPSRGKNSGVLDGVPYFQVKRPGAGSFLRESVFAEKRTAEMTLKDALLFKYTEHTQGALSELYATTVRNRKKPIELVGVEQVQIVQEQLQSTVEIALQSCCISEVDSFGQLIPKCTSLLLDSNLLYTWTQALSILGQMPQLHTLSLSYNRLTGTLAEPVDFGHRLQVLAVIGMDLTWRDVAPLFAGLRELKELLLCKNRCCDIEGVRPETFPKLTLLNLEQNGLSDWSQIHQNFSTLPNLEKLILNENQFSSLSYSSGFPQLTALSLNTNSLQTWSSVNELGRFPAGIKELRIQHNPVLSTGLSVTVFRFQVIARIASLLTLNGAFVRSQERIDAERFYLRLYHDVQEERESSRYRFLEQRHGDLSDIGKALQPTIQVTLQSTSASVKIVSLAKNSAGREVVKKLPLSTTVLALRTLCSKVFGLPVAGMKLTYREGRNVIMPETLDDGTKELGYYMMHEGGEIWVEDI